MGTQCGFTRWLSVHNHICDEAEDSKHLPLPNPTLGVGLKAQKSHDSGENS